MFPQQSTDAGEDFWHAMSVSVVGNEVLNEEERVDRKAREAEVMYPPSADVEEPAVAA